MVDLKVTITIPEDKITDFKNGFLKAVPRPKQLEHLTDVQYLKQYLQDVLFAVYKTGKIKIAQETTTPTIDEDIVTVS